MNPNRTEAMMLEADLDKKERAVLRRICRLNGAGWSTDGMTPLQRGTVMKLHERGLVQGKSGLLSKVVHTREGWALWKTMRRQ